MPRIHTALFLCSLMLSLSVAGIARASEDYSSWTAIAQDMVSFLNEAGKRYGKGDVDGAKNSVNDAYFGLYEKMGFERTVMSYISGKRVSLVEYKFSYVKKEMTRRAPEEDVLALLAELNQLLLEDAAALDGTAEGAPAENDEFIMPTDEEIREFEAAISPEGLTPEEFEEKKIQYILEKRRLLEEK